jgi:hypothetical protein
VRAARLTVAQPWRGGELEQSRGHVLDLTASGARIEHGEPLNAGGIEYVDLPPALGWYMSAFIAPQSVSLVFAAAAAFVLAVAFCARRMMK